MWPWSGLWGPVAVSANGQLLLASDRVVHFLRGYPNKYPWGMCFGLNKLWDNKDFPNDLLQHAVYIHGIHNQKIYF